eukprot:COSAG03_NODE_1566_length_3865_cov_5.286511_3_plen_87_part_00
MATNSREQLGAGNAGFATSWELPGSWEPGSFLRKTASWEAILGIETTDYLPASSDGLWILHQRLILFPGLAPLLSTVVRCTGRLYR